MKYFIDTEFIEGFFTHAFSRKKRHYVDLISIGIVREDGREFYRISSEYRYDEADEWVKKNVIIPMYTQTVHGDARNAYSTSDFHLHFGKTIQGIKADILEFVKGDDNIEFYGYYADYDWVVFCSLFGRMIDLPEAFPMYCKDLKQMMDDKGLTKEWKLKNCPDPEGEHNALVDAKWDLKLFNMLNNAQGVQECDANTFNQGKEPMANNNSFTEEDLLELIRYCAEMELSLEDGEIWKDAYMNGTKFTPKEILTNFLKQQKTLI